MDVAKGQYATGITLQVSSPQHAALHQVLKFVFLDMSQSRRCLNGRQATDGLHISCTNHRSSQYSDRVYTALVPSMSVLEWHVPASLPSFDSSVQGLPNVMLRKALQADTSASTMYES